MLTSSMSLCGMKLYRKEYSSRRLNRTLMEYCFMLHCSVMDSYRRLDFKLYSRRQISLFYITENTTTISVSIDYNPYGVKLYFCWQNASVFFFWLHSQSLFLSSFATEKGGMFWLRSVVLSWSSSFIIIV